MRTLPNIKRITDDAPRPGPQAETTPPKLGSATPTEEVPRIEEPAPASEPEPRPAEVDEDVYETLPRITINPEHALEPEPEPEAEAEATTSEMPAQADAEPAVERPPVSPASPAPEKLPYEDTLRFHRPERDSAESSSAPQARKHVTSGELIDALEELLPRDDERGDAPPSDERPDAQVHEPAPVSLPEVGELIDAAKEAGTWSSEAEDRSLSASDRMEMRVQQVLEQADRQQRHRQGLECLVDILEYRELRLRSLRGEPFDKERFEVLQTQLQQQLHQPPSATHDMASMRRYHRFVCSMSAQLTHRERGTTSTVTVEVEDLSAGGAKVTFGEYSIDAGDVVWLAFDLTDARGRGQVIPDADTVVFKARVVWARAHDAQVGLIFAGAPRYGDEAAVQLES